MDPEERLRGASLEKALLWPSRIFTTKAGGKLWRRLRAKADARRSFMLMFVSRGKYAV